MSKITIHNNQINTIGELPTIGTQAPNFTLTDKDMTSKTLSDYNFKTIILNIFPSVDTETCASSVRAFNKVANDMSDVTVLCISKDLPFALGRFCGAEGLDSIITLSDFKTPDFGRDYGLTLVDGPLAGLLARAVIIIKEGKVAYTQLVLEITNEPNYDEVLANL
jgi:thioredoxin-dependent peroxiredoxin